MSLNARDVFGHCIEVRGGLSQALRKLSEAQLDFVPREGLWSLGTVVHHKATICIPGSGALIPCHGRPRWWRLRRLADHHNSGKAATGWRSGWLGEPIWLSGLELHRPEPKRVEVGASAPTSTAKGASRRASQPPVT